MLGFKVPAKAKSGFEQLAFTLDELVDHEGKPKPPSPMMPSILGGVYEDYMRSKYSNFDNRRQDLLQLQKYAEKFDDLEEFLSQLSLLAGQDAVGLHLGQCGQDTRAQIGKQVHLVSSMLSKRGLASDHLRSI